MSYVHMNDGMGFLDDVVNLLPNTIANVANPAVTAYATYQDTKVRKKEVDARVAETNAVLAARQEEAKLAAEIEKLRIERGLGEQQPISPAVIVVGVALAGATTFALLMATR